MVLKKQARQTVLTGTLKTTVYCRMLQVSINIPALSCIQVPTPLLKHTLWDLPHRWLWQAMLWELLIKTNTTMTLAFRNKHQSHQKFQEARDNLSTHIQSAIYNPAKGVRRDWASSIQRAETFQEMGSTVTWHSCAHKHTTHLPS